MIDRVHRELTHSEIDANCSKPITHGVEMRAKGEYADVPGFCKSTTLTEVKEQGNVLTPGRYVGAEVQEEDSEPFEDKIAHLTQKLTEQMAEARRLDEAIAKNLEILGFGEDS